MAIGVGLGAFKNRNNPDYVLWEKQGDDFNINPCRRYYAYTDALKCSTKTNIKNTCRQLIEEKKNGN